MSYANRARPALDSMLMALAIACLAVLSVWPTTADAAVEGIEILAREPVAGGAVFGIEAVAGMPRLSGARSMGAAQRSHQVAAEIVVIHLERVARRFLEVPMRGFAADPGGNVGGTRQVPGDLQGGDTRLVIGEPPDASDRLK